ncbi:MAG TPA: oligosaccharide flippase family protein [Gaiellaceae bacterium]|nr:oligosaccharide flippase family protein [Gaiellaceae bacterium]
MIANSAWSLLAQGVTAVVGGLVGVYAVRSFTPAEWGHYATALALIALFMVLSSAGVGPQALRAMTADRGRQGETLGVALQALAWASCIAAVVLIAVIPALGYPQQVLVLVVVFAPLLLLDPVLATLTAAFNARSQLAFTAWYQLVQCFVSAGIAVAVIAGGQSIVGLAFAALAADLCAILVALALVRTKLRLSPRLGQPPRRAFSFLRTALPIGGIGLVGIVYDRVDTLMLSVLSSATSVARYNVPFGFVRLSWLVPSVISAAFFPLLSRRISSEGPAVAAPVFFLMVRVFLFLSVPISLALAVSSPTLLPAVFGPSYAASAPVLQILAWTSVFGFQNYLLWYGLLAVHREKSVLKIQVLGLVVNVAVNAWAIPRYGPSGAAAALVASDLVVVMGQVVVLQRRLFSVPYRQILTKPLLAAAAAVPVAVVVAMWSPIGGALLGAAAYVALLLVLGYITATEWKPITSRIAWPRLQLRRAG